MSLGFPEWTMKVTVCINDTKIVVPCGDGNLSVRQLAELAIIRYRKTVLSKTNLSDWIEIASLKLARDGGILDWDDKVKDVLDDKDMLIAQNSGGNSSLLGTSISTSVSSPPLIKYKTVNSADNDSTCKVFSIHSSPVKSTKSGQVPLSSNKIVPGNLNSYIYSEHLTTRHNSIPLSEHDLRHFDFSESITSARHESLDDILDFNSQNKMLNYSSSLNKDYERWPLPPFPTISTLQSSTDTTLIQRKVESPFDSDEHTWDNSPNECDEDYPRLRSDYIVKHLENSACIMIDGPTKKKEVMQWLESQECGSVGSSGGGGGGTGVCMSSFEACSDNKEPEMTIIADALDDRNNNRVHASSSSMSSGNEHKDSLTLDALFQQLMENSITVKMLNPKTGENLGIQIMPAYLQNHYFDSSRLTDNEQKSIYGIEVHSIMPDGRVAKERQFNKGDKIIQINDVRLIGMSYEKGESIFRDALTKPECRLRVIPHQYPSLLTVTTQISKLNPPPPPRRSPNTALSRMKQNLSGSSESTDKAVQISVSQPVCKSPIPTTTAAKPVNTKSSAVTTQNPVSSWTSGLGSMVHTPASSTLSVPTVEKKKVDKNPVQEPPKTELIELTKIGTGFGFSITGKDNLPPNIPSVVYVRNILPDGAAIRDGRLKSGDRLLEIDGLLLDGMSQNEVISLLREKPSGSRVKLLIERNSLTKSSQISASHDSLITSVSEIEEDGSTLSKTKQNSKVFQFDIPLTDHSCPEMRTTLGISVKVEPNWEKASISPLSSKEDIDASNIVWVKTVIEDGAAYRHGKLKVGDELLKVNDQTLSGLSSDEALSRLKTIIKKAQESDDGIIRVVVKRKTNLARSSSLTTLNSMTGSGSANSFMPYYDRGRNPVQKLSDDHHTKNIPISLSQYESIDSDKVPNQRLPADQQCNNITKVTAKISKRSAPLPPPNDVSNVDTRNSDKISKVKPAPPPPLARRLKKTVCEWDMPCFVPFSETTSAVSSHSNNPITVSSSLNLISHSFVKNFEPFDNKEIDSSFNIDAFPNYTSNTLCRHKDTSHLHMRARNTRSDCSFTPTNEILHIDDVDWEKMELIPFENCQLSTPLKKSLQNASSASQSAIDQEFQSKRFHDPGASKRRVFKKFSISQLFRFKQSSVPKPANSAGSSPIAIRKQANKSGSQCSADKEISFPSSTSSHSIKSCDQHLDPEFPYADLDFTNTPPSTLSNSCIDLKIQLPNRSNARPTDPPLSSLLPLPEESFTYFQPHTSEDSDSYEDFEDVSKYTFSRQKTAVQRISAAVPKQPLNRFVYEDAEQLFQSLQNNMSVGGQDIFQTTNTSTFLSSGFQIKQSIIDDDDIPISSDVYQNIMQFPGLSDVTAMDSCDLQKPSNGFFPSTRIEGPYQPSNANVYSNYSNIRQQYANFRNLSN